MDIWKEAPALAEYYDKDTNKFYMLFNGTVLRYGGGCTWEESGYSKSGLEHGIKTGDLIERPKGKAGTNENALTDNTRAPFDDLIYCLGCWRDAEAEDNLGDAHEWLHHVRRSFDAYLDWESAQNASQDKPKEWNGEYTHEYSDRGVMKRCTMVSEDVDAHGFVIVMGAFGDYVLAQKSSVRRIKSQAEKEREDFVKEFCDFSWNRYGNYEKDKAEDIYDWLISSGRLDTKGNV